jgi:hypothetical protein
MRVVAGSKGVARFGTAEAPPSGVARSGKAGLNPNGEWLVIGIALDWFGLTRAMI